MHKRFRTGGLATWCIHRPVAVTMLALTVIVLGMFALDNLKTNLLPHIIYPEVRVRIIDPGVPIPIMEDNITRQLEEQLAITEGAISVQSRTREGRSSVDLSFPYGTDINIALRDASTRLDRAKRFLPTTIDPPVIYKRDPSQIPVMEIAISSDAMDITELRDWVEYDFRTQFITLPGVATAEPAGGQRRQIHIVVDQEKLAQIGLTTDELASYLEINNIDISGGRLIISGKEFSTRTKGRFQNIKDIKQLPITITDSSGQTRIVLLSELATVLDTHEDERLRVRFNGVQGIKLSIQKQPEANTVDVANHVSSHIEWLKEQNLIPDGIEVEIVDDQSVFVEQALNNASMAAISGATLAMLVVYFFLGNLRRTLIIGTAIPLAIVVTFIIMALSGLTLNIMTLGGLALGIGLLVDNTIVMLENITRHQATNNDRTTAGAEAAGEVTSALVASTSTNLAAILPFLFIGGLIGLIFSELVLTLTAAILASLIVAITIVPSLGTRSASDPGQNRIYQLINSAVLRLHVAHKSFLKFICSPSAIIIVYILMLLFSISATLFLLNTKTINLPKPDQGIVRITLVGDPGIDYDEMDQTTRRVEEYFSDDSDVQHVFVTSGGRIFGRSEYEASNFSTIRVKLKPGVSSNTWIKSSKKQIRKLKLIGKKVRFRMRSVRGLHLSRGDDDVSIRIQGPDINTLRDLGETTVQKIKNINGLRNVSHTYEDTREEFLIYIDRDLAASYGITVSDIGKAVRIALEGHTASTFIENDREYNIVIRMQKGSIDSAEDLNNVIVAIRNDKPVRLGQVATTSIEQTTAEIMRDKQRRIVEIQASVADDADLKGIYREIDKIADEVSKVLPDGYYIYDGGTKETLQQGEQTGTILVMLALFLVFVVMAVQYESLRNPIVIILSVPLAITGVALGVMITQIPMSMTVWLGLIMLAGIVVNNAIVFVEQIEIEREKGLALLHAITEAARLRLRPILMTTLTTVVGMLPLAIGIGEGSEMLQPLAIAIVSGLIFSMFVSLLIVPGMYYLLHMSRTSTAS